MVGLKDAADKRAGRYSGGMKKRLDLASTLVHKPKVLFLDEPTTGLDPQSRATVWDYLEELNKKEGITIFLTTQYLEEADRLCQRLCIVDSGQDRRRGLTLEPEEGDRRRRDNHLDAGQGRYERRGASRRQRGRYSRRYPKW